MNEKVKGYLEKAKEFLKKVPKKVFVALAVLVIAALVVVIWLNNRPYVTLFSELNSSDLSAIVSYLEEAEVADYKIQNNDTVLVKENQEDALRAAIVQRGYPTSGFAFTTRDTNILATETERKQSILENLQTNLSATVSCFDNVRNAIVYLNAGEDTNYILDSSTSLKASASVFVEMNGSTKLTSDQAAAIRSLIANSVKGLEVSEVEVLDTAGNRYSTGDSVSDSEASALKLQLEDEYENKIRTEVMQVLVPFYGVNNVKVGVSCTVDINQTVTESTEYFLPPYAEDGSTNGRGIVGSRIFNWVITRDAEDNAGGQVGTTTNSDFSEYVEDLPELNGNETHVEGSGQTDYKTNETNKQIIQTAGYLTDCFISVSINSTTAGNVNVNEIAQHVARASGITGTYDEEGIEQLGQYISIVSGPFYEEDEPEPFDPEFELPFGLEMWMIYAAGIGLLLFLIILLIIIGSIKKRKKKKKEEQEKRDMEAFLAAAAAASHGTPDTGADVMSMQSEKSVELRKDIRKFAEENPEIAAQMLKAWLRGGEENG